MGTLSYKSAVGYLKAIYKEAESGYVDSATIYRNLGLDENNYDQRHKLYEWLDSMQKRGWIEKEHERGAIKGIRLTPDGHRTLDGAPEKRARLARWVADAEALQALYPEVEIIYDMRLRKDAIKPLHDAVPDTHHESTPTAAAHAH